MGRINLVFPPYKVPTFDRIGWTSGRWLGEPQYQPSVKWSAHPGRPPWCADAPISYIFISTFANKIINGVPIFTIAQGREYSITHKKDFYHWLFIFADFHQCN